MCYQAVEDGCVFVYTVCRTIGREMHGQFRLDPTQRKIERVEALALTQPLYKRLVAGRVRLECINFVAGFQQALRYIADVSSDVQRLASWQIGIQKFHEAGFGVVEGVIVGFHADLACQMIFKDIPSVAF